MKEEYEPEKRIWSEKDFQAMGWHDCTILALALEKHNLLLDIDYILNWVEPSKRGDPYKFWVSPATLIFENIHSLAIDIDIEGWNLDGHQIEIDDIEREDQQEFGKSGTIKQTEWKWTIMLQEGDIVFRSIGYKQYLRKKPILSSSERLGLKERGGISLSTDTYH